MLLLDEEKAIDKMETGGDSLDPEPESKEALDVSPSSNSTSSSATPHSDLRPTKLIDRLGAPIMPPEELTEVSSLDKSFGGAGDVATGEASGAVDAEAAF